MITKFAGKWLTSSGQILNAGIGNADLKKLFETKHLPTLVDILEGDRLNPDNIYALEFPAWYNKAAAGVVTALIKNASMPAKYRDMSGLCTFREYCRN